MKARILVVDDEAEIRRSLRMILEYEGYDVQEASSGPEAIALIEREPPDLAFLDIKMPGMDGLETLEKIRGSNESLPVVIVSGHGTVSTAVEATKLGAFDFIEKPLASERVLVTIRNALDRTRLQDENRSLKRAVEARHQMVGESVSLPLVMPPVATGLILLMLLSRRGSLGRVLERLGIEVVFTWKAVVLAMAIMGLPLLVRTARAGFEQVNARYERVAATLGASPARVFLTISLPLAWPSVLAGAVLAFARALGEFGATIMVAGAIPGATRTLSSAIYGYAETGQDAMALQLLLVSVAIAFVALWTANRLVERSAG